MFGEQAASSSDKLAAVYGCVQVIASAIAAMPLHLYRTEGGVNSRDNKHPVARFLSMRPNEAMTWPQLREAIAYQTVLRGNQHCRVFFDHRGYPEELFPLPQGSVTPKLTDRRRVVYEIGANDFKVPAGTFSRPQIAHFKALSGDGLNGINPIEHCRQTMVGASALAQYGTKSAAEGAPIRGIITNQATFKNSDTAKEVRKRWKDAMDDGRSGHGIPIFEGGDMKFHNVSMSMRDAQYIENMAFSVEEICRIFNVPPHKVQKLDRATFNNIEHLSLEFYTACLVPWITRMEATYEECLLSDADRANGYSIRHNPEGLLRGDQKSRSEAYKSQISMGVMTVNEARSLENRPPVDGGERAYFPINHTVLSKIGEETQTTAAEKSE